MRSRDAGSSRDQPAAKPRPHGWPGRNSTVVRAPSKVQEETQTAVVTITRDEFARAARFHQAGDLVSAARMYESILKSDQGDAGTLHMLGVLRHQQGDSGLAIDLIERALVFRPDVAVFHASLAEAQRALGLFDQAVASGCEALQRGLNDPAVANNLGLALHALKRHDEAAGAFLSVLQSRPDDAMAHTNLGAALHALGEDDRALEHLSRAVELDPRFASARTNLGQFLLDLGLPHEALSHCQAAVALEPGLAEAHNNLGNAYWVLGQIAVAVACFGEAARLSPRTAQFQTSLGRALQQEERWDEALTCFRRATELEPDSMPLFGRRAEAAVDREQLTEAIACYERMLEIEPGAAATHNDLGTLLQEEGRIEESENHLQAALRLRPDLGIAHVNLGGIHEKRGDLASAEAEFRMALKDAEASIPALARLASLLRGELPDSDREAIETRLAALGPSDPTRVNLLFGLAAVWEARGNYAEAAKCAREANALALARLKRRNLAYDPALHERFVSELIEAFSPSLFSRLAGAGLATSRPVFIVGMPRSGTTLIEQILASHSQFHGAGELALVRRTFHSIPEHVGRDETPVSCVSGLTREVVRRLAEWHNDQLNDLDGGRSPRIGDKMPDNYIHLGLLHLLFPNATFIHCRRDPRDVAVSCWFTGFRTVRWTNDERHIAARVEQYERLMNHWRASLPAVIHEVDYENTVADLEGVARRLLAACKLDWEPACLEFHRTSRPVRTASYAQVRQPVYRTSIGRYKNYETQLADLFAALS
jgi:tetratricopeptide (TPR) repeat protein